MARKDETMPMVNPLSMGSTERNEIKELAVRAVDEIMLPHIINSRYMNKLPQLFRSLGQKPEVGFPAKHEQSEKSCDSKQKQN